MHARELIDVVKENLGYAHGRVRLLKWDEMCILGEPIHNYKNNRFTW